MSYVGDSSERGKGRRSGTVDVSTVETRHFWDWRVDGAGETKVWRAARRRQQHRRRSWRRERAVIEKEVRSRWLKAARDEDGFIFDEQGRQIGWAGRSGGSAAPYQTRQLHRSHIFLETSCALPAPPFIE